LKNEVKMEGGLNREVFSQVNTDVTLEPCERRRYYRIIVGNNPVNYTDPFGLHVGGFGLGIGGNFWHLGGSLDCSFYMDDDGNKAIVCCHGGGGGYAPGKGWYAGVSSTHVWSADTVCDLVGQGIGGSGGHAGKGGGGVGFGPAVSVSGSLGGLNVNIGVGAGGWGFLAGPGVCNMIKCWGPCCKSLECPPKQKTPWWQIPLPKHWGWPHAI
jgi:hypothetical protein